MSEPNEEEYQAWMKDLSFLAETLAAMFESEEHRFYEDEMNNTLYVELEGLDEYSEEEISEIAGPVLEELDLDFEEILLLPLAPR
ncbi:MAG: hypothetical protein WDZ29_06820 [Balneolaceae bacterium]